MKRNSFPPAIRARWRRFLSYCFPAASRSATSLSRSAILAAISSRQCVASARTLSLPNCVVSTGGSISTITRPLFQRLSFILFDVFETHRNNRHPSGNSRVKSPGFKRQQAAAAAAGPSGTSRTKFYAFKSVDDFGNSAVRFGSVITVNQQITGQPVQLAKERDPQQAFYLR